VTGAVVQTSALTKVFGKDEDPAVDGIDLSVAEGSIVGLIGPSGSGKTTVVRLLTGLLLPTSGEVTVLGRAPSTFSRADRERIGYVPQGNVLFAQLSVAKNLRFFAAIYGMGWRRRRRRTRQTLSFVDLWPHRHKRVAQISGGMKRRLSLACALVHDPTLLFLDEPTAGIDPILRRRFWDHFATLRDQGRTLFVTTQYVGEAAYCDYVAVLASGRLLLVDTPAGLRRQAFGGDVVDIRTPAPLPYEVVAELAQGVAGIRQIQQRSDHELRVVVPDGATAVPELIDWLRARHVDVDAVERYLPPFDDVFVQLVERAQAEPTTAAA